VKVLVTTSLFLVIVLVSLSAYLRLAHSGIGCADWPDCYGRIGEPPAVSEPVPAQDAYQQLVRESNQPLSWATPLHRLVASVLGLLVMSIAFLSIRRKRQRLASLTLLALTVYLAVLGVRSGGLHDPVVVMGNLAGGFSMLGLLGWMVFSSGERHGGRARLTGLTLTAIVVLSTQILLGGLTSANFAATSCQTLPDCHGSWWPGSSLATALDLSRKHEVTSSGQAIGGEERLAIHKAHRLGSILTVIVAFFAALTALRAGPAYRAIAVVIIALVTLEFLLGITAILTSIPISLAVAHNWFAGLLLLSLLKLFALATKPISS
jgi:cytochrome c oxidase assembly protein subunit 15